MEIRIAATDDEKQAVYRSRCTASPDDPQHPVEPEDENSWLIHAVASNGEVAGSYRVTRGSDGFSLPQIARYELEPFLTELPPRVLAVIERLVLSPTWDDGDLAVALLRGTRQIPGWDGILVVFGAVQRRSRLATCHSRRSTKPIAPTNRITMISFGSRRSRTAPNRLSASGKVPDFRRASRRSRWHWTCARRALELMPGPTLTVESATAWRSLATAEALAGNGIAAVEALAAVLQWSRSDARHAAATLRDAPIVFNALNRPDLTALLIGAPGEPTNALEHLHGELRQQAFAAARQTLGDDAYERLVAEGAKLKLDDVLQLVLSWLDDLLLEPSARATP